MATGLSDATRFQDLLDRPDTDGPYDFPTIFPAKGWGDRRRSKKKFKLLKRIDPEVREMLEEGERVQHVTWGTAVSFLEAYFFGWVIYYLNQRALVVTDRRVLMIQIDTRRRPGVLRDQLRYAAIERIKGTLLGNTQIRMRDGKTRLFSHVPRKDRAVLQQVLRDLRGKVGPDRAVQDIEHLCPRCYQIVRDFPATCPSCGTKLKSPRKAVLLSLAFPGLGVFYLGYRKLGAFKVVVAALVWLSYLMPDPQYPMTLPGILIGAVFLLVFMHGGLALATRYLARRGVYPAR